MTLTVTTTDADGKPVGAVVGVTVTDDSVLEMIEKREQRPRLPAMVLLEDDVKELADADVYLDPADPRAPLATDLLLGTQGWRRFALGRRGQVPGRVRRRRPPGAGDPRPAAADGVRLAGGGRAMGMASETT